MSYQRGNETWEGVVPDENHEYLQCEKCGSKTIKMVAHIDGRDFYGYSYRCENGHEIVMRAKRNPEDMMFWE